MKARIKWIQDVMFLGESGSGHAVVMDGAGMKVRARPSATMSRGTELSPSAWIPIQ